MVVDDLLKTSPTAANKCWLSDKMGRGWEVRELGDAVGSEEKQCTGKLKKVMKC